MAIINKNSITFNDTKPFNGLAVNAPLVVDKGADGSFAVAAHQIYWGNTYFNGSYLTTGTTQDLLTSIEAACAGLDPIQVKQIIEDYLNENGALNHYIHENELEDAVSAKGFIKSNALPTKVSELENDSAFITRNDLPTDHVTYTYFENTLSNYILEDNLNTAVSAAGFIKSNALPTKVSELENDSKFITINDVPEVAVPKKVSELENDSNFITIDEIPSYYITEKELEAMDYITETELAAKKYITLDEVPSQEIVAADLWENF
jgi:hypothetical protein